MHFSGRRALARAVIPCALAAGFLCPTGASGQATPAPTPLPTPAPVSETIVVSATKGNAPETEIPGEVTVVTGEELRQRNVTNLADAIQDVMGVDTGMGSDNGPRQPNVGIWGLKEFDALLFMVDGIPIGGPFNPSLSQINIDDIDRIEIVKGPQGTLYGVSAFTGMVQVFTKGATAGTSVRLSGGSFDEGRIDVSTVIPIARSTFRLWGNFDRADGWQDRTDYADDRGGFRLDTPLGDAGARNSVVYNMFRNTQFFGSPLPVDPPTGEVIPGFQIDRNYEPIGARLDHRVYAVTDLLTIPAEPVDVAREHARIHAGQPDPGPQLHQRGRRKRRHGRGRVPQAPGDRHLRRPAHRHELRGGRAPSADRRRLRDLGPDHGRGLRLRHRHPDRPRDRAEHAGRAARRQPRLQRPPHLRGRLRQRRVDPRARS